MSKRTFSKTQLRRAAALTTGYTLIVLSRDGLGLETISFIRSPDLAESLDNGKIENNVVLLSLKQARGWCVNHPEEKYVSELIELALLLKELDDPLLLTASEVIAGVANVFMVRLHEKKFQMIVVPLADELFMVRPRFLRLDVGSVVQWVDDNRCVNAAMIKPLLTTIKRILEVVQLQ